MAAPYDVLGHPLLSEAAGALDAVALDEYAAYAAERLGYRGRTLADAAFTVGTPEHRAAQRAVALQVSHHLAGGADAELMKAWRRGERSVEYRDGVGGVHPGAQEIATAILTASGYEAWPLARSVR